MDIIAIALGTAIYMDGVTTGYPHPFIAGCMTWAFVWCIRKQISNKKSKKEME